MLLFFFFLDAFNRASDGRRRAVGCLMVRLFFFFSNEFNRPSGCRFRRGHGRGRDLVVHRVRFAPDPC